MNIEKLIEILGQFPKDKEVLIQSWNQDSNDATSKDCIVGTIYPCYNYILISNGEDPD